MTKERATRHSLEQALAKSEARERAILDTVVDGIITIDTSGTVLNFNRAAEKIFGYRADEVIGQNVNMLMPDPTHSEHDQYIHNYLTTKQPHVIGLGREVEGLHRDGHSLPLELAVSETCIDGEIFFTGILRDISERKTAEREIIRSRDIAERSTRAKSEFLANMSHEIRTPMNAVINLAYLARQDSGIPEKTRSYLTKIETAGKNLLGIINDILDLSKIEAGKLDIEQRPFDLHNLLEQLTALVSFRAQANNVEVMFHIEPEVPHWLNGDALRLNQVLTNLVGNAIKFTQDGEVVLHVSVIDREGDTYRIRFAVTDTGIGMSEEQLSQLFQPFNQADGTISRRYGGSGLGLAISKQLIEMMHGTISVSSEPGKGSLFTFDIQLPAAADGSFYTDPHDLNIGSLNILVIDDNQSARLIFHDMLTRMGFKVTVCPSGEQGLEVLRGANNDPANAYHIVMLDWNMPGLNGLDTLKLIKQDHLAITPKVILCTAYGVENLRLFEEAIHTDAFLSKPFNPSTLLDVLVRTTKNKTDHSYSPENTLDLSLQAALREISGAHILLVDDNEINQLIGVDLLESQGFRTTVASSAQEAFSALEKSEFDLVLMDVQMPELDGLEATRILRRDQRYKDLPILAMTAHAMAKDRVSSLKAGMNDHLTKPIDPQELYRALVSWIGHRLPVETA